MIDEKKLIEAIETYAKDKTDIGYWYDRLWGMRMAIEIINQQPKIGEWIPYSERLPENAKHKGSLCPRYQVNTEYGVTEGWYNPDTESWYCLFWFLTGRYDENDIDFKRGDKPRIIKVPMKTGKVVAWQPLPEPWEGEYK